jgi:hypothetical protein
MSSQEIAVTTHVARDLLQSAGLFQHEHSVVWEYVVNGLQYTNQGVAPIVKVHVDIKARRITIHDNGRGMDRQDLQRYFKMHAENLDRKLGRPGRGLFGTGKSAAFGIANVLKLTTVKSGKRSRVQLTRARVEAQSHGNKIPVEVLEDEVATTEANGTTVEIEQIHLRKIDVNSIIRHIERHIAHWPNVTVFINHHECSYVEPPVAQQHTVGTKGTPFEARIGQVELVIKIAKSPLPQELQGIAVFSHGVWHETTLVGCEKKPFANYLFGTIEVPAIGSDTSPNPPFDMSRKMQLNPRNEIVAETYSFIGMHLEAVRREIEKQDRERRKREEAKKLQSRGDAIAELINEDFNKWRDQVRLTAAKAKGGKDKLPDGAPDLDRGTELVFGKDEPVKIVELVGGFGRGNGPLPPGPHPHPGPGVGPKLAPAEQDASDMGKRIKISSKPSRRGGFRVEFLEMGAEEPRAKYERDERAILVNLDHPQIAAALGSGGIEEPVFLRLAYEVAFSEYAIALAWEMAAVSYYLDATEPIVDIRETLNRLARTAASLYAAA